LRTLLSQFMLATSHSVFLSWDIWAASLAGPAGIQRRQIRRLSELVAFARCRSPFFRELYQGLPEGVDDPARLPPVSKPELMARFDEWVTDADVNLASAKTFVADSEAAGTRYLDRYGIWATSGTSGEPGLFLHDQRALTIYDLLLAIRGWAGQFDLNDAYRLTARGRMACILATAGHFAGISSWLRLAREYPWLAPLMRHYSVMTPLPQLVDELNDWQPAQVVAYPSVLALLAREQIEKRMDIGPAVIFSGGERLGLVEQKLVEKAFNCSVRDVYAASECDYIAFSCDHGWLHVNADWVILEPVDEHLRPVPPGITSHSCLLTNLANQVQPIIRYDLGDGVTVRPDRCGCGSLLPAVRVDGRRDQALTLEDANGQQLTILPMAITSVLDNFPGLHRFQIIQTGPSTLTLRCEMEADTDENALCKAAIKTALIDFLAGQNVLQISIEFAAEAPSPDPKSGKFHQTLVAY
jgi:phenylacetate-CoA ligase